MYGKLIDGVFSKAPKLLKMPNGMTLINPQEKHYKEAGYKMVVVAPAPSFGEGQFNYPVYTEDEEFIYKDWETRTYPPREKTDMEKLIGGLIGREI